MILLFLHFLYKNDIFNKVVIKRTLLSICCLYIFYNDNFLLQVSALLTGVHRAFPFAVIDGEVMHEQMETMYKIAHMSTFNIALHAFMLLFQVNK